jgi:integrase
MNEHHKNLQPEAGMAPNQTPTLADVLAACEAALEGSRLRDTRSAFGLMERAGIKLASVIARPTDLRTVLAGLNAAALGISAKSLSNAKSLIRKAVVELGFRRTWITRKVNLAPEWKTLLVTIVRRHHRWGLSRLAAYCTLKGIKPEDVTPETLIGFEAWLETDVQVRVPVNIRKTSIGIWNSCARNVPGWPQVRLSSPFKPEAYMLPVEAFPEGFQRDVAAWESRNQNPNPLDPDAPLRAMRPATLSSYRFTLRRLASALVRAHGMAVEAITSISILFEGENLRNALRPFLAADGKPSDYVAKMAAQMLAIGKHFLKLPHEKLAEIERIVARVRPIGGGGMGKRNRDRLAQFDDVENVQRLLDLPNTQMERALAMKNPVRRAKGVEKALLMSLSIFASIRAKNLRSLRLDHNIRRAGDRLFIELFEDETKTHTALTLEMPAELIGLLDFFVEEHRPLLPGADSNYLFPGQNGGPRSYSAIRDAVGVHVGKIAGIKISPHLYRHAVAKIVVEQRPELAFDVSRRLGHKRVNTTYQAYLGTEGPSASRRINELLQNTAAKAPASNTRKPPKQSRSARKGGPR